jgi:hypothetical protein
MKPQEEESKGSTSEEESE